MTAYAINMDQSVGFDLFVEYLSRPANGILLGVRHRIESGRHAFTVAFRDFTGRS
jgi:hypothetical protein